MKSGEFLLMYFAADETKLFPFPAVVGAMVDVDRTIRAAAAMGDEDAGDALEYIDPLWASIVTSVNRSSVTEFKSLTSINAAMRLALRMADRLTPVPDAYGAQEQRDRLLVCAMQLGAHRAVPPTDAGVMCCGGHFNSSLDASVPTWSILLHFVMPAMTVNVAAPRHTSIAPQVSDRTMNRGSPLSLTPLSWTRVPRRTG